jgi:phosphopentomutase
MSRAFLVVMDSVGCGGAPDADRFFNGDRPDTGANTWGHIVAACAAGRAEEGRSGPLKVPHLAALGLGRAIRLASGLEVPLAAEVTGRWGAATEVSMGKDTPSGHWELAGVPVPWDWTYFPDTAPAFPKEISDRAAQLAGTEGILGNRHASGTAIIEDLGAEHLKTGWPICYTSADSVFQIAAHEEAFGLERLQKLCADLAPTLHAMRVGRVIARPFTGAPGSFRRTKNRHDYAMLPPAPTLLDWVQGAGRDTHAVGKIGDIFSMRGIGDLRRGADAELMEHLVDLARDAADGSLTFANFVEFDTLYGHRRDVSGYARALEWFDAELPRVFAHLAAGDMILFTADHGNDPTWTGTDHTRERVPVLVRGQGAGELGLIAFAGVADLVARHLGVAPLTDR